MRRALVAVVLGGALLTAACGTDPDPTAAPSAAAAATSAAAPTGRSAKDACDAVDPEKDAEFKSFTALFGTMVEARSRGADADATAGQAKAVAQLKKTAAGLRAVAAGTADAEIGKNIVEVAAKMEASAGDTGFFAGPKTVPDLEKALTTAILTWYNPILASCS